MKNHKIQQRNSLETQKCFSQIYSTYFIKMTRFSQAYVIAEEDAENIVQDIFLYLWEHPEVLKTIDNMDAFLFTLVKNQMYGEMLADVENVDDAAEEMGMAFLKGRTLADEIEALATLTVDDVNKALQTMLLEENSAYIQIDPKE